MTLKRLTLLVAGFALPLLLASALAASADAESLRFQNTQTPRPASSSTPPAVLPTIDLQVDAAFQPFENGWMIWRSDTDTVFMLFGDGEMFSSTYDPDYPIVEPSLSPTLPPDRSLLWPRFDLTWKILPQIRERLGWPLEAAQVYTATVIGDGEYGSGITLPDGRAIYFTHGGSWFMMGITSGTWRLDGETATFVSPSYPTLTPTPSMTPIRFAALYQPFEYGFMVWDGAKNCVYALVYTDTQPSGGILIPAAVLAVNDISSAYHYCQEVGGLPDFISTFAAPDGLFIPLGAIGKVWGAYDDLQSALGYALEAETAYNARLVSPPPSSYMSGAPWTEPVITLPDGRILSCGFRAATAGSCSVE